MHLHDVEHVTDISSTLVLLGYAYEAIARGASEVCSRAPSSS